MVFQQCRRERKRMNTRKQENWDGHKQPFGLITLCIAYDSLTSAWIILYILVCKFIVKKCITSKSELWVRESAANWQGSLARGCPGGREKLDQSLHDTEKGRLDNSVPRLENIARSHETKCLSSPSMDQIASFEGEREKEARLCREQLVQWWLLGLCVKLPRCQEGGQRSAGASASLFLCSAA